MLTMYINNAGGWRHGAISVGYIDLDLLRCNHGDTYVDIDGDYISGGELVNLCILHLHVTGLDHYILWSLPLYRTHTWHYTEKTWTTDSNSRQLNKKNNIDVSARIDAASVLFFL